MSFILDALRRADRDRQNERGEVPSLYAQAAPLHAAPPHADDDAPRPWLWLAAGLGGGLVLAAAWALGSATPSTAPVAVTPPAAVPPSPVARPAQVPEPAAPVVAADLPPAATPAATPAIPPDAAAVEPLRRDRAQATEGARPSPPRTPTPAPARPAAPSEREVAVRTEAPTQAPRALDDPAPAQASSTPLPIRQLSELSAAQRSSVPTLAIGGAMYSAHAASRRLIVNGQLLREGEAVAPGVTLEEIRLKSAVLRSKELRVEIGF